MAPDELNAIARSIVDNDKGILAADESTGTITKRFDAIGVESTEENRRAYRNLLFTTPGMEEYIGGVILFDETIRQSADDGTPFPSCSRRRASSRGSRSTPARTRWRVQRRRDGDGGPRRLARAARGVLRARRAVREVARDATRSATAFRSGLCIAANAHALARYAALCQEAGIVPIVEPEVLMDTDHSIDECFEATARTLAGVFAELYAQRVELDGILLKPNMVIPGKGNAGPGEPGADRRGDARVLPAARAGRRARDRLPLGRPVRGGGDREPRRDQPARRPALDALVLVRPGAAGVRAEGVARSRGNVEAAQARFLHRARMNALAAGGRWSSELEQAVTA